MCDWSARRTARDPRLRPRSVQNRGASDGDLLERHERRNPRQRLCREFALVRRTALDSGTRPWRGTPARLCPSGVHTRWALRYDPVPRCAVCAPWSRAPRSNGCRARSTGCASGKKKLLARRRLQIHPGGRRFHLFRVFCVAKSNQVRLAFKEGCCCASSEEIAILL